MYVVRVASTSTHFIFKLNFFLYVKPQNNVRIQLRIRGKKFSDPNLEYGWIETHLSDLASKMLRSVGSSGSKLSSDIFLVCSFLLLQLKIPGNKFGFLLYRQRNNPYNPTCLRNEEREKIPQKIFITFKNWLSKTKINFTFKTLSCPQTMLNVLSANGLQKNLFVYFHWRAQYELLKWSGS